MIRFKGGQADENRISAITSMQCKIGGKHTLKGVGKNPRLAHAKSKNDKNISGLLNQIIDNKEAGKIGIHTFTNASSFTVGESDVKIISIEFAPNEAVMAQFFGAVIVGVSADQVERSVVARGEVVVHFTFEFNDNIIEIHQPEETWHSGKILPSSGSKCSPMDSLMIANALS